MQTSNVTSKGQITVPAKLRKELGMLPGSKVRFVRKGSSVLIERVREPDVSSLFGVLKRGKGQGVKNLDEAIEAAKTKRARTSRK